MEEKYIAEAKSVIKVDAEITFEMCMKTAESLNLDEDWVLDTYLEFFRKIRNRRGD